jgi:flagella basal body P-ring formation protein FlgA
MAMVRNMIRKVMLTAAIAATLAGQAFALETMRPKLKAEAVVTGDLVRVGDLVANAGVIADVPIFRAPDLGATGTVPAAAVAEAVRQHALVGLDTAGLSEVTVIRVSRAIAVEDIESRITRALSAQFALGKAKDIALNYDSELRTTHVESTVKGEPRVGRVTYDARTGRFTAVVDLPSGANARAPLRLSGHAVLTAEVAVLASPMARGAVLKDDDVVMERRPRTEVGRGAITDRALAVGFAVRNAMDPGRPLQAAQLMKPEMIQRNDQVTIVYQVPGVVLTVRGKAADGGAEGDTISVLNEQSKRTVQGVIVGPGRVLIDARLPHLAANLPPSEPNTKGEAHQ